MRKAFTSHHGYYFLWIWGLSWMLTGVIRAMDHPRFWVTVNWLSVAGFVVSVVVGVSQSGKVRGKVDKRFLAVGATLLAFGYLIWPIFFQLFRTFDIGFAFQMLVWMQVYIVAGIWFANSLLWVGLVVTALILVGFLCFPAFFWVAMILSGATMIGSGFYIRSRWC
ncbi:MAG TPA: hypothetical protein VIJ19_00190 [Opitutaceae bacterium]